jgi:hypothetical protein
VKATVQNQTAFSLVGVSERNWERLKRRDAPCRIKKERKKGRGIETFSTSLIDSND